MSLIAPKINEFCPFLLCGILVPVLVLLPLWLQELSTSSLLTALPSVKGRRTFLIRAINLFCSVDVIYITENFGKHFHHSFPLEFSIGSNIITFKVLLYTITLPLSPCFFMFSLKKTEFMYLKYTFHFHSHPFFIFVTVILSLLLERIQEFKQILLYLLLFFRFSKLRNS